MYAKHPVPLAGIVTLFTLIVIIAFSIVGCEKPAAPVQDTPTMIGDRLVPPLPKTSAAFLFRLNPTGDPSVKLCENSYSSGGFNQTPIWVSHSYNLSAYAHRMVQIRFVFNTRDGNYNKFEGWYLDDITIGGYFNNVESGAAGWTVSSNQTNPTWQITNHRSYSASNSWYYGRLTDWTFRANPPYYDDCFDGSNAGTLKSPIIVLGANPVLAFKTLWQIEAVNPASFDLMDIYIEDIGPLLPVDIHPAGCPNPLNVNAKGVLPVALCGASWIDWSRVDLTTLMLQGVAPVKADWEDVTRPLGHKSVDCDDCSSDGPDGYPDYVMKFDIPALAAALGEVQDGDCIMLMVTGKYTNGYSFAFTDHVKIIKKK